MHVIAVAARLLMQFMQSASKASMNVHMQEVRFAHVPARLSLQFMPQHRCQKWKNVAVANAEQAERCTEESKARKASHAAGAHRDELQCRIRQQHWAQREGQQQNDQQ